MMPPNSPTAHRCPPRFRMFREGFWLCTRVLRTGDKFLFETEEATHEKVFQNLFRFTFAGDFFVEDLSENYEYFEIQNLKSEISNSDSIVFESKFGKDFFVPKDSADDFLNELKTQNAVEISDALYEVLRIENGMPLYGVDIDETNVVLESGLDEAVNFNKGCYVGQEIIARIHFRGHVAKKLTGLIFEDENADVNSGDEIKSAEGQKCGKNHIGYILAETRKNNRARPGAL